MAEKEFLTVTELNSYLNGVIDNDSLLWDILVKGEVSGVSIHKDNLYCNLKDDNSQIPLCCFNLRKTYTPKEGDSVYVSGQISYYVKTGKLSFIAKNIEPCGLGKLHEIFQDLKISLAKEGLFDTIHKIQPPLFPLNICVVTSKKGAVIQDIYKTICNYNNNINVFVYDVSVQGLSAEKEIVNALKIVDGKNYDLVVLARGGGSFEDLYAFNSESVARAIFQMKTFIISAVGHEVDYTISDAVSDVRCATPTAAAEFIVDLLEKNIKELISKTNKIFDIIKLKIDNIELYIKNITKNMLHKNEITLLNFESKVNILLEKINAINPTKLFEKGFYKIYYNGNLLSSFNQIKTGDELIVVGLEGEMCVTVKNFINKEK